MLHVDEPRCNSIAYARCLTLAKGSLLFCEYQRPNLYIYLPAPHTNFKHFAVFYMVINNVQCENHLSYIRQKMLSIEIND